MIGIFGKLVHKRLIDRILHNVRRCKMNYQHGMLVKIFSGGLMRFKYAVISLEAFQIVLRRNVQNTKGWSRIVGCPDICCMDNRTIWQSDVVAVFQLSKKWPGWDTFIETFIETKSTGSSLKY